MSLERRMESLPAASWPGRDQLFVDGPAGTPTSTPSYVTTNLQCHHETVVKFFFPTESRDVLEYTKLCC